jgi:hypothetical protein
VKHCRMLGYRTSKSNIDQISESNGLWEKNLSPIERAKNCRYDIE